MKPHRVEHSSSLDWHLNIESRGEHTLFRVTAAVDESEIFDRYYQPAELDEGGGSIEVFSGDGPPGPLTLSLVASFKKPGEKAARKVTLEGFKLEVPRDAQLHLFVTIHRDLTITTRVLREGTEQDADKAADLAEQVEESLDDEDWARVEKLTSEVVALDPLAEGAYLARAQARAALGRLNEALEDIQTELALAPDAPELLYWRASVLSQLGRHDEALLDAEIAVELDPEDPDCLCTLGEVEYRAGDIEAALKYLREAIELDYGDEESDGDLLEYLRSSKLFEPHRQDPRFRVLFSGG